MGKKITRDVEKVYSVQQFAATLRRLASALEKGKRFRIQVAGQRVSIPGKARISIEHERSAKTEEVEFQLTWER
jgi:amphi-Trp domain-containing protein